MEKIDLETNTAKVILNLGYKLYHSIDFDIKWPDKISFFIDSCAY
jgi:hypothetical protein